MRPSLHSPLNCSMAEILPVIRPRPFLFALVGDSGAWPERSVVVVSNAPQFRPRVAALVHGAEGRGLKLHTSEVVRDSGGGDPVIVMVWEGQGVVKTMGKLRGIGQDEYATSRPIQSINQSNHITTPPPCVLRFLLSVPLRVSHSSRRVHAPCGLCC